jgi:hypothetical protein
MAFYEYNIVFFVVLNAVIAYLQHRRDGKAARARSEGQDAEAQKAARTAGDLVIYQFKWDFLPVYLLAFGSDWLQVCWSALKSTRETADDYKGPYIYTMYKGRIEPSPALDWH